MSWFLFVVGAGFAGGLLRRMMPDNLFAWIVGLVLFVAAGFGLDYFSS